MSVAEVGNGEFHEVLLFGDCGCVDDQRVVAGCHEWVGQALEESLVVVVDGRGFAVDDAGVLGDLHAVHRADALVTQADTHDGDPAGVVVDDVGGVAGLGRGAGAGGDDHVRGAPAAG